jgi:hypothetical protein
MPLHLIKLCVGIDDLEELRAWRAKRRKTEPRCLVHTRNTPRRAQELLDGGSLYWVIKGHVQARQRVLGFESGTGGDGRPFCRIELDHELVPTEWRPSRPFQGWRYLAAKDAPADRRIGEFDYELPAEMAREMR